MISLESIVVLLILLNVVVLVLNFAFILFSWRMWRQLERTKELMTSLEHLQQEMKEALERLLVELGKLTTSLDFVVGGLLRSNRG
jgi:hypothetical protein